MSSDYTNSKFKELLDKLQQESWQLELLISGFAIFGLFTAYPEIKLALQVAKNDNQFYLFPILFISLIACSILLFNLMIHVILRGLWIGALGLRYVSGDIDFDKLNYYKKFGNYLQKRIVSFDKYVATLENYCSVLFAVSFLLIFYIISISIIILSFVGVATLIISNDSLPEGPRTAIGIILILIIALGAMLVFIDFITQGFLKKKKWLAKLYFPFYWIFSYLTLTFLYRPLVYNFLDNKFTKRLSFFLVPAYLIILVFTSFKYQKSNYLDNVQLNSKLYLDKKEYDDLLIKEDEFVKNASIQSKVITEPYIKFFKVFNDNVENRIYGYHPSLKPTEDQRGFKTGIQFSNNKKRLSRKKRDSLAKKYLEVFNEMYIIKIDSLKIEADFLIGRNKKNQIGFETYIPTKKLSEGKHILRLNRKRKREKDTLVYTDVIIPFWHFKQ